MSSDRRGAPGEEAPELDKEEEEVPPDRMVKIEIEAAEALADLAQLSSRMSGSPSGGKPAQRARKRVKTESPLSLTGLNLVDSSPSCPDLAQDGDALSLQQHEKPRAMFDRAELEQCEHPLDHSNICTTNYSCLGGGRSRQNLSEAEKEAKRLRRVLANRESARRTIRRRQALCEELSRKAVELTEENERLKKGKEAALREFELLETTNKHLKAEVTNMEKAAKYEMVETKSEIKPAQMENPASLINFPMFLHNSPFTPGSWPPILHNPNTTQQYQVPPALPFIPANATPQGSCWPDRLHEQSLLSIPGSGSPMCIFPRPWFIAVPNQGHHCGSSSHCPEPEQDEKTVDNRKGVASSVSTSFSPGNCDSALPVSVKLEEAPGPSRIGLIDDLNEVPVESHFDEGNAEMGVQFGEASTEPIKHVELCSDPIKRENTAEVPSSAGLVALTEEHQGSAYCSGDEKLVSVTAAAQARRRRKELTKLKAMQGRQCRTHC